MIARHLDSLFPGMTVRSHAVFRVIRDADFTVSDEADDLVRAVETELRRRRFGEVVQLEVAADMDADMRAFLIEQTEIEERQVLDVAGMLDLDDLWQIHKLDGHLELREAPWTPVAPGPFASHGGKADVFAAMRAGDLLVHHPYESFAASVERFVEQAVDDPNVLAIKMTVYRTSDDSALVPMLIKAAERGKQAVCLVELKARFDERRNIGWARSLEEAGAHVVHGLPGLKTHAKALLVVRREGDGVRHYVHVGTGNYHAQHRPPLRGLRPLHRRPRHRRRRRRAFQHADRRRAPARLPHGAGRAGAAARRPARRDPPTVEAHEAGQQARIVMKMNSLVDRRCIRALYEASQAGVQIDLNVRGICCLIARHPRRQRQHPRRLGSRPLPGALARVRLPARRRAPLLHRLGRPDAAQPRLARRAAGAGATTPRCAPRSRTSSSAASPTTRSPGTSAPTAAGRAARGGRARCTAS